MTFFEKHGSPRLFLFALGLTLGVLLAGTWRW